MWLTFLQLGVPLGVVLGYITTSIFVSYLSWKYSFYLQMVCCIPILVLFLSFPSRLIQLEQGQKEATKREGAMVVQDGVPQNDKERFFLSMASRGSFLLTNKGMYEHILPTKEPPPAQQDALLDYDRDDSYKNLGYIESIRVLWSRKIYIYMVLCNTSLFFVITGLQFWVSDYLISVLDVPQSKVSVYFALVCTTSPLLGVLFGGKLVDSYGGYTSPMALKICLWFSCLTCISALPLPFVDNFIYFVVLLWLCLFFGACLLPPLTGILISSVPKELRPIAASCAQVINNLFGYLPSPMVYGIVIRYTGGNLSRYGMILLGNWTWFSLLFLYLALKHQSSSLIARQKELNEVELAVPEKFQQTGSFTTFSEYSEEERRLDSGSQNLYVRSQSLLYKDKHCSPQRRQSLPICSIGVTKEKLITTYEQDSFHDLNFQEIDELYVDFHNLEADYLKKENFHALGHFVRTDYNNQYKDIKDERI